MSPKAAWVNPRTAKQQVARQSCNRSGCQFRRRRGHRRTRRLKLRQRHMASPIALGERPWITVYSLAERTRTRSVSAMRAKLAARHFGPRQPRDMAKARMGRVFGQPHRPVAPLAAQHHQANGTSPAVDPCADAHGSGAGSGPAGRGSCGDSGRGRGPCRNRRHAGREACGTGRRRPPMSGRSWPRTRIPRPATARRIWGWTTHRRSMRRRSPRSPLLPSWDP